MSEIKSTLDLVMERTRHLTLSAEEKAQQRSADFEKRLQGLLRHYAEGALSLDTLQDRIDGLQTELQVTNSRLMVEAVFKRLDPDGENERWLDLLAGIAPPAHDSLRDILAAYREREYDLLQKSKEQSLDCLARYGIRGSAVVPNPQKNPQYQEGLAALRQETQTRIEAILNQATET